MSSPEKKYTDNEEALDMLMFPHEARAEEMSAETYLPIHTSLPSLSDWYPL